MKFRRFILLVFYILLAAWIMYGCKKDAPLDEPVMITESTITDSTVNMAETASGATESTESMEATTAPIAETNDLIPTEVVEATSAPTIKPTEPHQPELNDTFSSVGSVEDVSEPSDLEIVPESVPEILPEGDHVLDSLGTMEEL